MLSERGNPVLSSLYVILDALGMRLSVERKPEPDQRGERGEAIGTPHRSQVRQKGEILADIFMARPTWPSARRPK
jgi:hypothetical protein